ncbi:MAG TPA: ATP-dependent zinc metalloprotease FtsH [Clostridia bacterium]|nr:ATP-dependent zinc metalloprotease FtsH [Clostridia bacterium]HOT70867.1 ATP-dependent zinc metalloprotease FtsH [Clostridia bacterium]HQG00741.1 ATP-dependent zinc metalloprotease FtsH [Clostridia bacterium]HQH64575.1 ATP-dependent zinc metalloprotease FtsH [Clostridia bacterium]HQJ91469.1 ATP-dependent zinc metalloprotease FtsH [Clostridia bacterium]
MSSNNEDRINNVSETEQDDIRSNGPNQINSNDSNNRYSGNTGRDGGPASNVPRGPNIFNIILIIFLITFIINTLFAGRLSKSVQVIQYSQFMELVESGNVSQVLLSDEQLQITISNDADLAEVEKIIYPTGRTEKQPAPASGTNYIAVRMEDSDLIHRLADNGVAFSQVISNTKVSPLRSFITMWIIPTLIMYLIYFFVIRNVIKKIGKKAPGGGMGGIFGVGKSKAKEYNIEKNTGVTFDDVAGQDEAKESLKEMVDFLHNPEKYREIGAKQPKGALLVGPPGTGKTLLAKAVAGESGVPFYSISGSEFVEMFVGVGASRVRDLFENAKKNTPCIIFIDEIDAIGKRRDNQLGSNDEREQTLNQLLAEMDGFDSGKGIVVLAATNRPEVLDKALLRPGRFDRRIIVDKPDLIGREAILKVHAAKVKLDSDVNLREIALATSGATGADLANMINEGALLAVKEGRQKVSQKDLMEAVEVVIAGKEKKDRVMNPKEREMVAYHEVGHALVSALQKNSQPVQKITIVPRTMGSLGYTMSMPEEERYLMTESEILAQITTLLGGRAAENLIFGEVSTGASNDIERATKLARGMITQYGMSDKFGPMGLESTQNQYLDGRNVAHHSEQTGALIDKEVSSILVQCQQNAFNLLQDNRDALERISKYLLEKENITGKEFMQLLEETRSK